MTAVDELKRIERHLFSRSYMSGADRNRERVKATGEVFTPTPLVEKMLDQMNPELFSNPETTFLDHSCGDGQFLASVLYRKLKNGIDFEPALSSLYGVDIMEDNVIICKERLLCGYNELSNIVERQIVIADSLRYHFRFDESEPYDDEGFMHILEDTSQAD